MIAQAAVPFAAWRAARRGLGGFQRFDSLAVEANGNICVATLITGCITVISPDGAGRAAGEDAGRLSDEYLLRRQDMRTAYITLSAAGQLAVMEWPDPGLRLNYNA